MKRRVFSVSLYAVMVVGLYAKAAPAQDIANSPQFQEMRKLSDARSRLYLRQVGVAPDTAAKAVWALSHKPDSDCAFLTREILSAYEGAGSLGEGAMLDMERYQLCEPQNLNKHKPQYVSPPYDKNKDPIYQIKLFFRDHPQEAHDMLAREGVPENVIKNASIIFADGDYHMDSCTADISGMIYDIRDNRDIEQDLMNLTREGECRLDDDQE